MILVFTVLFRVIQFNTVFQLLLT